MSFTVLKRNWDASQDTAFNDWLAMMQLTKEDLRQMSDDQYFHVIDLYNSFLAETTH